MSTPRSVEANGRLTILFQRATVHCVRCWAAVLLGSVGLVSAGCGARALSIEQDRYVNNAMHHYRAEEKRTGEPLEVSIVCVHPKDLERDENASLKPGSGITCRTWYENRPKPGGGGFMIPPEQIYLLTNATSYYGKKKGPALNGATKDGRVEIPVRGIRFRGTKLHSRNSVIYVFPKFIGQDGKVLPVKPAEFSPPGRYTSRLSVKIGVDKNRGVQGQYIVRTTGPGFSGYRKGE